MDTHAAAAASMSAQIAAASVNAAHCRKCGSRRVAWVKNKAGKSYLCEVTAGAAGKVIPSRHRPHFKVCDEIRAANVEKLAKLRATLASFERAATRAADENDAEELEYLQDRADRVRVEIDMLASDFDQNTEA